MNYLLKQIFSEHNPILEHQNVLLHEIAQSPVLTETFQVVAVFVSLGHSCHYD
jgi:hypothetical protein